MSKKIISLLLIASIAGSIFTGCSKSKKETETVSKDASKDQVTLKISWWGSQNRHDKTLEVLKMYEDKNSKVKFQSEFSSWDGYWQKLAAQAAGNSLPDIIQMDYQFISQYGQKGLIIDLNSYVKDNTINLSDADENSISGGRIEDKLYAINLGNNAITTIYDPDIFKKAGIAEPKSNWTWEEYMNIVSKIKEKTGVYGDGWMAGGYYHLFKHYLRQHGFNVYSRDGKSLGYTDDKYFIDFFGIEMKLAQMKAVPTPAERLEIKGVEDELIVKGKAAMTEIQSNQLLAVNKAANKQFKLNLLPKDKNQVAEGHYVKPSMFFSITKDSKNVEKAADFISYFINDIDANKVLLAERGVPISSKVRDALKNTIDDTQKDVFDYIELVIDNSSKIDPPDPQGHPEIEKLLKSLEEQMLFNQITIEAAAKKFREQATSILAK